MGEGLRLKIYYICMFTGVVLSALMFIFISRKKGVNTKKAVMFVLTGVIAGFLGAILMAKIDNAVTAFVSDGTYMYVSRFRLLGCLFTMPLFSVLPVYYSEYSCRDVIDFLAPGLFLNLGLAKIGCAVYGCCYGVECAHGVINPLTGQTVFPVQLCEALLGIAVCILGLFMLFRAKKIVRGSVYPVCTLLFSVCRFFLEFLRSYEISRQDDLLSFLNLWQIVCLIAFFMGALWLVLLLKKSKKDISTQ